MEITNEEHKKLEQYKISFKVDRLTKEQIELILGREITVPPSETDEAVMKRQARLQRNNDPKVYSIKRLFKSPQRNLSSETPKFKWSDIAKHAAVKGKRWQSKNRPTENTYRINKLFRPKLYN